MSRKDPLVTSEIYHVMNKSIAGYVIFRSKEEYIRMRQMLLYYSVADKLTKFSRFMKREVGDSKNFEAVFLERYEKKERLVQILAYCIMPTHLHLAIKQLVDNGIKNFMSNISNSYARYFNIYHERKGPLWVHRFKNIRVKSDEQLIHLTRYIHLNPVTADLARRAREWEFSSIHEYIRPRPNPLCHWKGILEIDPGHYEEFVDEHASTQKELALAKK